MSSEVVEELPTPTYPLDIDSDGNVTVRRLGSGVMHRIKAKPEWFIVTQWVGPTYWAIHWAMTTACGAVLRPDERGLVAMKPGTKITCARCRKLAP